MNQVLKKMTPPEARRLIFILFFALAGPSLPAMSAFYINGDLGGGTGTTTFGAGLSLLGIIVTKPFGIILAKNIGRLKLLRICIFGNLITTILVIFNSSYIGYLFLWFCHGLASGPVYLIVMTTIRKYIEKDKVLHYTKFVVASLIVSSSFGAGVGAILSYQYDWRWSFFIFCIIYMVCIFFLLTTFNKGDYPLDYTPIDWIGYAFYAIGFISLGFCLTVGLVIDGFRSTAFNFIFIIGVLCFTYFLIRNYFHKNPIIAFKIADDPFKLGVIVTIALFIFAFHFAIIVLLSHWLHLYVNYSLKWVGWILSVNILGTCVLPLIYKHKSPKVGYAFLTLALALILFLCLYISRFNVDVNLGRIMFVKFLSGIAIAIFMPSAMLRILSCCRKGKDYWGLEIFSLSKSIGSFLGVAYFSTLWTKRSAFFYTRLGGELTEASEPTLNILKKLTNYNFSHMMKLAGLNDALERQARALALDDCFFLVAIVMAVLIALLMTFIIIRRKEVLVSAPVT